MNWALHVFQEALSSNFSPLCSKAFPCLRGKKGGKKVGGGGFEEIKFDTLGFNCAPLIILLLGTRIIKRGTLLFIDK